MQFLLGLMEVATLKPLNSNTLGSTNMPSIIFSNGDTSKEVALSEVNSVEDVASHMKEVMTDEQKTTLEELSSSDQPNWFKDGNLDQYYQIERG